MMTRTDAHSLLRRVVLIYRLRYRDHAGVCERALWLGGMYTQYVEQ